MIIFVLNHQPRITEADMPQKHNMLSDEGLHSCNGGQGFDRARYSFEKLFMINGLICDSLTVKLFHILTCLSSTHSSFTHCDFESR